MVDADADLARDPDAEADLDLDPPPRPPVSGYPQSPPRVRQFVLTMLAFCLVVLALSSDSVT